MAHLIEVFSDPDYQVAIELFRAYASEIDIDLEFQNFSEEIENIKLQYARPAGVLFIVKNDENKPLGCFGIRKWNEQICELKRMYLKVEGRGLGIGQLMMEKAIAEAKEMGYEKMRLDTLSQMHAAIGLYKKMGFYEVIPYRFNPFVGAKFFEIELQDK
ncbi:GNAT family N-acetyltransferase [Croceivirga thetidis]|uniref:GNAT family N-acetyltransferase n=1 Tax=Croceivirga thetidis TaxID=2721623 RepID=A0ABX1GN29_9FLAO|nr:GNAT family N-acetyltransferase [Croceivirga thetidis]NKI30460.1 GNAT family N-acetyltransferase [Croceivirga thetidis]